MFLLTAQTLSVDGVRYQTDGDTGLSSTILNNLGNFFSTSIAARTLQVFVISGVPGDYNRDGTVDAADYAVWRKAQGTTMQLPNDNGIGGMVGLAQYNLWRSGFGTPGGSGRKFAVWPTVPEPAPVLMAIVAVAWLLIVRLRTNLTSPIRHTCCRCNPTLIAPFVRDAIQSNPI